MTMQHVQIQTYDFGATLSPVTLRNPTTDAVIATADTCEEIGTDAGVYLATFDETSVIAAGQYRLRAVVSGSPINRWVTLAGVDAEVAFATMERAAISSGTGARTVTITVNDGSSVLQNAIVRMAEGANTFTGMTNASGVVTFNLDDATYVVSITKSGYSYSGTTLVVDGTETRTYSMTQIVPSAPDNPDNSLLTITCRTPSGVVESGVVISVRKKTVAVGDENNAYSGAVMTDTSGVDGITSFEVVRGATYQWKRGTADSWTDIVIDDADATDVTSIVGSRY
jgi:hypothetical protein